MQTQIPISSIGHLSQQQLADKAIVSLNALARLEKGSVDSRVSTVNAVQKALMKAGIEFLDPAAAE
jgi:predicted transcriptional regulator